MLYSGITLVVTKTPSSSAESPSPLSLNSSSWSTGVRGQQAVTMHWSWSLQLLVYSFHSVLSDMQRFLLCYLWLQHSIRLYWGGKTRGRLQKHGDPRQLQARHYTPAWRITINCLHRSKKIAPMKNECQLMWSLMRSWLNIIAREEKSKRWFWVPGVTKTGGETETMKSDPMELDWLRLLVQFMGHHHVV